MQSVQDPVSLDIMPYRTTVEGVPVVFDEIGAELDHISVYDQDVELFGSDEDGKVYSAVGTRSVGIIVELDKDTIEVVESF